MEKFDPKRLKKLRLKANLTQEEVAERIGVHPISYARWESGKRTPRLQYIERLANFFKVPTRYFFTTDDYQSPSDSKGVFMQGAMKKQKIYDDFSIQGVLSEFVESFKSFFSKTYLIWHPSEIDYMVVTKEAFIGDVHFSPGNVIFYVPFNKRSCRKIVETYSKSHGYEEVPLLRFEGDFSIENLKEILTLNIIGHPFGPPFLSVVSEDYKYLFDINPETCEFIPSPDASKFPELREAVDRLKDSVFAIYLGELRFNLY